MEEINAGKALMLFSHDGIHDSQTHLSSPLFFYEQLRREISLATRAGKPIALIKIVFNNPLSEQVHAYDILHFSYELAQLTREEECVGRLGVNEVVIIVPDGKTSAEKFVQRLHDASSLTVSQTLQIHIAMVIGNKDENSLQLLHRLDQAELLSQ